MNWHCEEITQQLATIEAGAPVNAGCCLYLTTGGQRQRTDRDR